MARPSVVSEAAADTGLRADGGFELGISVRQLHVVFECAELTFTRTLAMMRIAEAQRLLVKAPALPITEVAYACGFESLATFYRFFKSICGVAPGEFRATGFLS